MGELMRYSLNRSSEDIKSVGGLCLIGQMLKQFGFADHFSSAKTVGILKTEIALLCQSRTDFNDVELFRDDDDFFAEALDLDRVPSEPTLRQHLKATFIPYIGQPMPTEPVNFGSLKSMYR